MSARRNFLKQGLGFLFLSILSKFLPTRLVAAKPQRQEQPARLPSFVQFSRALTGAKVLDEIFAARILVSLDQEFSPALVSQTLQAFARQARALASSLSMAKEAAPGTQDKLLAGFYANAATKALCQKALRYWYADFQALESWSIADRAHAYRSSCLWAPLHTNPVGVPVGPAVWAEKPV